MHEDTKEIHPARSLGEWIDRHGRAAGLLEVSDAVRTQEFEASAVLEQLESRETVPPVLFSRPVSLNESTGDFQILFNSYASLTSLRTVLECEATSWPELLEAYARKISTTHPVEVVRHADSQANVQRGDDVDLTVLPWTRHVAMDGGPYFTPITVTRAPQTGRYNLSWNRAMYLDRNHIAVHISPRHLWTYHREKEGVGEPLNVALVLGHHPAFNLGAAALTSEAVDEYEVAGALMGAPVRVAPSLSYGDDLLVPADAEVLVEGRLLAGQRAVEGPFGEYLGYVGPQKLSHVLEVDAISWRDRAVALEIFTSHIDHYNACIAIELSLFQRAREAVPQVSGVSWFRGGGPTTLIIGLRKTAEGQAVRAALAAMAASNMVKQVIVVDDDIHIDDPHHVMWAMSTRMRVERDFIQIGQLQGNLLDPSQSGYAAGSGFVMDATMPLDRPYPPAARVPAELVDRYPLDKYSIEAR